jgi:predicted phage-related endonuclease
MKLPIVRIDKDRDYQQWLTFRDNGLGASEVAAVMGMSQYKCSAEVYYQKIGMFGQMRKPNLPMIIGNIREPELFMKYEYWGGTEESFVTNYMAGTRVRRLYAPKFFVLNPDMPHLFFSPDALELKDYDHGRKYVVKGNYLYTQHIDKVIEFKTVNGWAFKQWDAEFNPAYGIQLSAYLMGMLIGEGRIFTEIDGREMKETTITYNEGIIDTIQNVTKEFWLRVEAGREAVAKGGDYEQFAPPPDGSESYKEFLKEKYANPEDDIDYGHPKDILEHAAAASAIKLDVDTLQEQINFHENTIKQYMGNRYSKIDFGKETGRVTWRSNVHGTRSFRNTVKPIIFE